MAPFGYVCEDLSKLRWSNALGFSHNCETLQVTLALTSSRMRIKDFMYSRLWLLTCLQPPSIPNSSVPKRSEFQRCLAEKWAGFISQLQVVTWSQHAFYCSRSWCVLWCQSFPLLSLNLCSPAGPLLLSTEGALVYKSILIMPSVITWGASGAIAA